MAAFANKKELERFLNKFTKTGVDDCWRWSGARSGYRENTQGYGKLTLAGNQHYAHRVSYEHFIGEIPKGFVVDHLCRNTLCVNPKHLEVVTNHENLIRGNGTSRNRIIIECQNGHRLYFPKLLTRGTEGACQNCENIRLSTWYFKRTDYPQTLIAKF